MAERVLCALINSTARKHYCRNAETLEGFLLQRNGRAGRIHAVLLHTLRWEVETNLEHTHVEHINAENTDTLT